MLSIFPDLLTFSLFAPFIIRILVGGYFLIYGFGALKKFRKKSGARPARAGWVLQYCLALLAFTGGALVLVGLYTQAAALALAAIAFYFSRERNNRVLYLLLAGMALSLLFSGAGAFAFDLPL